MKLAMLPHVVGWQTQPMTTVIVTTNRLEPYQVRTHTHDTRTRVREHNSEEAWAYQKQQGQIVLTHLVMQPSTHLALGIS